MKTVEVKNRLDIKNVEEKLNNIKDFRDLKAYKIMIEFYSKLYPILAKLPYHEQYGIFDQLDRCSMSIIANLAEGNGKLYKKVELNFYSISFGSANECQAWLDIMKIKGYIDLKTHEEMDKLLEEIKKLIISYIKRLASAS